jgi:peptidoglycan/LPS O-acetylase OafA/YrhL
LRPDAKPLYGLEILRFGAAFAVIVSHYRFFFFPEDQAPSGLPFYGALLPFYTVGYSAVPWFWALSGYIFFWNYEGAITDRRVSAIRFGWLRFSRLYPLHLATLILVTALQTYPGPPFRFYSTFNTVAFIEHLFLASNWFTTAFSFNWPIWSVSVEVLIYALFFALARAAIIQTAGRTAIVAALFLFSYWVLSKVESGALIKIAHCAALFMGGGLICKLRDRAVITAAITAAIALGLYWGRPTYALDFAFPILGVRLFSTGSIWNHQMVQRLSQLGNLTYGSYLLHFPVAAIVVMALHQVGAAPDQLAKTRWFFVAYSATVFGLSYLSFKYFERPMQALLRTFTKTASPQVQHFSAKTAVSAQSQG